MSGPDNRASGEQPWTASGTTDGDGKARVVFTVSMQPGNNYRAGASVLQDALTQTPSGQTMQQVADAFNPQGGGFTGYRVPLHWSPMLTVWRKLTLEVDSMDQEALDLNTRLWNNEWTNAYPTAVGLGVPDTAFTTVYHNFGCALCDLDNRWEGGAFLNAWGDEWLIVRNTHTEVTLWGNPGNVVETWCTIRDDDLLFANPSAPRQLPHLSALTPPIVAAYQDAYIQIVEAEPALNPNPILPWASNPSATTLSVGYATGTGVAGNWDIQTSNPCWSRRIVTCYQAGTDADFDNDQYENSAISANVEIPGLAPYPAGALPPLELVDSPVSGVTIGPLLYSSPALTTVYKETIRDKDVRPDSAEFWQYVAHEIGHNTFDNSGSQSREADDHAEGALMAEGNDLQNLPTMQRFSSATLLRFRGASKW